MEIRFGFLSNRLPKRWRMENGICLGRSLDMVLLLFSKRKMSYLCNSEGCAEVNYQLQ